MTAGTSHLLAQAVLPLADASGVAWRVLGAMGALVAGAMLALLVLVVVG